MEKTKVFAYRGIIGISSSPDAELIAPCGGGNLGCVADASKCEFSQEAIDLLKTIPKSGDAIGEVDVFKSGDGKIIFGWLGGFKRMVNPKMADGSRVYDPSLLTATENVEIEEEFKNAVDEALDTP